jgi:hypothetical protein
MNGYHFLKKWEKSFTDNLHPKAQGFEGCVRQIHATRLMDAGLFSKRFSLPEKRKRFARCRKWDANFTSRIGDGREAQLKSISRTVESRFFIMIDRSNWPREMLSL